MLTEDEEAVMGRTEGPSSLGNESIFYAASIVKSCGWERYNRHLCIGYSITASIFALLLLYTLILLARVTVCRDRFVSWLRRHTSVAITVGCLLLSLSLVIHLVLSPSATFEFAVIACHLISLFLFIFSRQMDQIISQPRPNDNRPKINLIALILVVTIITSFALAGAVENQETNLRCMSLYHIGSALLELLLVPVLLLQTRNTFHMVKSQINCPAQKKHAALRSIIIVTLLVLLSAVSSLVYTGITLSLGHTLGSCSAIFGNNGAYFMLVYPVYLVVRYLLPALAILKIYVEPDIANREEQASLLTVGSQNQPASTSKFQYPARFRHLEVPTNEPIMAPMGLGSPLSGPADSCNLLSGPGVHSLDNITEESSDATITSSNVRVSAGTQMSCVSELEEDLVPVRPPSALGMTGEFGDQRNTGGRGT